MTTETDPDKPGTDEPGDDKAAAKQTKHRKRLSEAIHDRLLAAEVAAEEAAGYGWATEGVEAVEAAANPAHELGPEDEEAGEAEEKQAPPT